LTRETKVLLIPQRFCLTTAVWYNVSGPFLADSMQTLHASEANAMTVSELEEAYQRLRDQLLHGELDEEDFRAAVEQLRFQDELGNRWKIGWYTGKWYRFDQAQWIQGTPVEHEMPNNRPGTAPMPPTTENGRRRYSFAPCLVILLVGLLAAASALLVFGWNTDWWQKPPENEPNAVDATRAEETVIQASASPQPATVTSLPTDAPPPSDTPSPTATSRPTVTQTPKTPTPMPTQTSTPTPTVIHTASRAASTATVQPTATPSMSGQIYFPVYDPNPDRRTFDIYVMNLTSGEREIVLGQASQPALSPNGGRLAYRSWDIDNRGIRARELSDENTWAWISFHEAEHASWSPDNQNLVFSSQQESDREWRLYRTWDLEIKRLEREGGDINGRMPTWSPDGRIIYWECPLGGCGLYAIQPDGTGLVRLTGNEHDSAPAVSPDGSQIAFMSNRDGNWEIYAIDAHRHGPGLEEASRLTTNEARDGLPTWSPDGQWIAFVSDRGGAWSIWTMHPDGSEKQKIFELGGPLMGEVAHVPPTEQHGWTWETLAWGE
jgi:TolB protein